MGLVSTVKETLLGRKRKVQYADPPRTIVLAHDRHAFDHWCHVHGVRPNDPLVIDISTATFDPARIQGYRFRSDDVFVVLETAPFGHGWNRYVQEILMRTGGWVDLEERKATYI